MKGVYIHIPFCKSRCNYCSFYSQTDLSLIDNYVCALKKEFEVKREDYPDFFDRKKATLYIGGGNPSLLDLKSLNEILRKILLETKFSFTEITIESNPDSINEEKVKGFKELGINRISLGIQSFDDGILKILGRGHNFKKTMKSIEIVNKYFDNFSIDIIGGIGGVYRGIKVRRDLEKDLKILDVIKAPHLSFYLLSVEEGSAFYNSFFIDEEIQSYDYALFCNYAKERSYEHYEISNFSKKGFECKHNKVYWQRGEYLGLGASSVSFFRKGYGIRVKNVCNIYEYLKDVRQNEKEILDESSAICEYIFLSLRTSYGLDIDNLLKKSKVIKEKIYKVMFSLKSYGFVKQKNTRWIIPEKHFIISNEIISRILKEVDL